MTYPSDVKDDEWSFLCLMSEDAPQRKYPLRALFNALRYPAHTGCPWRYPPQWPSSTEHYALPHRLPAPQRPPGRRIQLAGLFSR